MVKEWNVGAEKSPQNQRSHSTFFGDWFSAQGSIEKLIFNLSIMILLLALPKSIISSFNYAFSNSFMVFVEEDLPYVPAYVRDSGFLVRPICGTVLFWGGGMGILNAKKTRVTSKRSPIIFIFQYDQQPTPKGK